MAAGFTVVLPHLFGTPERPMPAPRSRSQVGAAGLRQPRVHQAARPGGPPRSRLAAQPGPRAARRARRTGRRRARHVLHRRLRAGDDGRRLGRGPGARPAVGAVRGRPAARRRPQPLPRRPRRPSRSGRPPAARCSACATGKDPAVGTPLRDPDPRDRRRTSSASSSRAASTPRSPRTASRRASTGCWRSSPRSCTAEGLTRTCSRMGPCSSVCARSPSPPSPRTPCARCRASAPACWPSGPAG